ncbi:MAG TPA: glycosyltransferase [Steroidobacteraceae bacterium]|nr:glycosyltransferase [Steroidobacteraceae bacterium]
MTPQLILSSAWFAIIAWLIARAIGQRHALGRLKVASPPGAAAVPPVAVIVPARNESANIGPCIESLLAQELPPDRLRILVVDDASTDATPQIVARLAARDPRLRLLSAPPLPPGWTGKAHACAIGARAAHDADWLCFIDADMRARPSLIASAVQRARADSIELLSLAPRQRLESFAERLLLPCGLYLLAFSQDLSRIQAPDSGEVVATGQFMLLARETYEQAGGWASVRDQICEDLEFARLLKARGKRVLMLDGSELLETRMYTGWGTLWPGIAKNLSIMLGGAPRTLASAAIAFVLAWAAVLLPLWDLAGCLRGTPGAYVALAPALAGSAAAFGLHLAGAVHFRIPLYYGLLFPVGYSVGAMLALDSVRWRLVRRVHWKGRVYPS